MTSVEQALGEFIDAWQAGLRPSVDTYLARVAESERDELAAQISSWLDIAPPPRYDDATRANIAGEPALAAAFAAGRTRSTPLPVRLATLRERAGLSVRDVAARIVAVFDVGDEKRAVQYLERLERGDLDQKRLSRRLLAGLAAILGADEHELRVVVPVPAAPSRALFRARAKPNTLLSHSDELELPHAAAAAGTPPPPMDELDRLFLGGPEA